MSSWSIHRGTFEKYIQSPIGLVPKANPENAGDGVEGQGQQGHNQQHQVKVNGPAQSTRLIFHLSHPRNSSLQSLYTKGFVFCQI